MDITKLIPTGGSFSLKKVDQPFVTRPIDLSDEIFMNTELGGDMSKILADPEKLIRLAYRLLTNESKQLLKKRKIIFYDENGDSFEKEIGGVFLLPCLVMGAQEGKDILKAVLASFGVTDELLKKSEEDVEKKRAERLIGSIGQRSSTPFQLSTDGQPSTSSPEPEEKLSGGLSG